MINAAFNTVLLLWMFSQVQQMLSQKKDKKGICWLALNPEFLIKLQMEEVEDIYIQDLIFPQVLHGVCCEIRLQKKLENY